MENEKNTPFNPNLMDRGSHRMFFGSTRDGMSGLSKAPLGRGNFIVLGGSSGGKTTLATKLMDSLYLGKKTLE